MIHGLENLKEDIRQKQFKDLAMAIVKYQKFRTSAFVNKVNFNGSDTTKLNYINLGIIYLNTKERKPSVPSTLYNYIDELVANHVQPLTPSVDDERQTYKRNYTRKNAVPPVAKLDIVNQKLTEKYDDYGILSPDNYIKVCKSRDYAEGYLEALKDSNKPVDDYKIIALKTSEV